jgi:hypothetical protein
MLLPAAIKSLELRSTLELPPVISLEHQPLWSQEPQIIEEEAFSSGFLDSSKFVALDDEKSSELLDPATPYQDLSVFESSALETRSRIYGELLAAIEHVALNQFSRLTPKQFAILLGAILNWLEFCRTFNLDSSFREKVAKVQSGSAETPHLFSQASSAFSIYLRLLFKAYDERIVRLDIFESDFIQERLYRAVNHVLDRYSWLISNAEKNKDMISELNSLDPVVSLILKRLASLEAIDFQKTWLPVVIQRLISLIQSDSTQVRRHLKNVFQSQVYVAIHDTYKQ